jgi:hypothetical protein
MAYICLPRISKSSARTMLFLLLFIFQFLKLPAQNEIPDSLVKERIQYIQHMLNKGKPAAKLWWNGWLYAYTAATVGQGVVLFSADKLKTRQDMAVGAATTLIGALGQLITPMVPGYATERLALIQGDTPEQRIEKLKNAEALFEASAKREKEGRSWKMHAASGVVNIGSGLVTWLGFKRSIWAGVENFALNTAITEAQIWTQPTRAIKDYKNYCLNYKSRSACALHKPKARVFVNAYPGGLVARLVF